jgi:hypothetical protein
MLLHGLLTGEAERVLPSNSALWEQKEMQMNAERQAYVNSLLTQWVRNYSFYFIKLCRYKNISDK